MYFLKRFIKESLEVTHMWEHNCNNLESRLKIFIITDCEQRRAAVSTVYTLEGLSRLRETADNAERYM
jgi:hypothetical protein